MNVLSLDDTPGTAIVKMCEGNPGAETVAAALLKTYPEGLIDLCHADDLGLRGSRLWVAYKRCDRNVEKLRQALRRRDHILLGTAPGA